MDKEASITEALVLRKGQNAGQIVRFGGEFLLGKIAHDVISITIVFCKDVKEERFHVYHQPQVKYVSVLHTKLAVQTQSVPKKRVL